MIVISNISINILMCFKHTLYLLFFAGLKYVKYDVLNKAFIIHILYF